MRFPPRTQARNLEYTVYLTITKDDDDEVGKECRQCKQLGLPESERGRVSSITNYSNNSGNTKCRGRRYLQCTIYGASHFIKWYDRAGLVHEDLLRDVTPSSSPQKGPTLSPVNHSRHALPSIHAPTFIIPDAAIDPTLLFTPDHAENHASTVQEADYLLPEPLPNIPILDNNLASASQYSNQDKALCVDAECARRNSKGVRQKRNQTCGFKRCRGCCERMGFCGIKDHRYDPHAKPTLALGKTSFKNTRQEGESDMIGRRPLSAEFRDRLLQKEKELQIRELQRMESEKSSKIYESQLHVTYIAEDESLRMLEVRIPDVCAQTNKYAISQLDEFVSSQLNLERIKDAVEFYKADDDEWLLHNRETIVNIPKLRRLLYRSPKVPITSPVVQNETSKVRAGRQGRVGRPSVHRDNFKSANHFLSSAAAVKLESKNVLSKSRKRLRSESPSDVIDLTDNDLHDHTPRPSNAKRLHLEPAALREQLPSLPVMATATDLISRTSESSRAQILVPRAVPKSVNATATNNHGCTVDWKTLVFNVELRDILQQIDSSGPYVLGTHRGAKFPLVYVADMLIVFYKIQAWCEQYSGVGNAPGMKEYFSRVLHGVKYAESTFHKYKRIFSRATEEYKITFARIGRNSGAEWGLFRNGLLVPEEEYDQLKIAQTKVKKDSDTCSMQRIATVCPSIGGTLVFYLSPECGTKTGTRNTSKMAQEMPQNCSRHYDELDELLTEDDRDDHLNISAGESTEAGSSTTFEKDHSKGLSVDVESPGSTEINEASEINADDSTDDEYTLEEVWDHLRSTVKGEGKKKDAKIIQHGVSCGWPITVDFYRLRCRVVAMELGLLAVDWQNNAFFQDAKKFHEKNKKNKSESVASAYQWLMIHGEGTGYYGFRGLEVILLTLQAMFPIQKIPSEIYKPLSYSIFILRVMIHEVAIRLFQQDLGIYSTREEAIKLIKESMAYGNEQFGEQFKDDDDDLIHAENAKLMMVENRKFNTRSHSDFNDIQVKDEEEDLEIQLIHAEGIRGFTMTSNADGRIVYEELDSD